MTMAMAMAAPRTPAPTEPRLAAPVNWAVGTAIVLVPTDPVPAGTTGTGATGVGTTSNDVAAVTGTWVGDATTAGGVVPGTMLTEPLVTVVKIT